jgi:UDP-N-acetylmuramoylalanine--D-glutamate ligase
VLNVTQDHLDWHGDMESYAADKAKIFGDNTVRLATCSFTQIDTAK